MIAEVEALMILAAARPTGMRTAVEVAAGAARMTGGLPPTNTLVVVAAPRAMEAADMAILTEVAAVEVTGELVSSVWSNCPLGLALPFSEVSPH